MFRRDRTQAISRTIIPSVSVRMRTRSSAVSRSRPNRRMESRGPSTATGGMAAFTLRPWLDGPCYVLVAGVKQEPRLRLNGRDTPLTAPQEYDAEHGWLIVRVEGKTEVEITSRPK